MAAVETDTIALAETLETSTPKEAAPTEPSVEESPVIPVEAEGKSAEAPIKLEEAEAAGEHPVEQPAASEAEQKRKRASILSLPFKKSSKKGDASAEEVKPVESAQESGAPKKEPVEALGTSGQKRKSLLNALKRVGSPKRDQFASPTEISTNGKEDKVEEIAPDTEATPETVVEATKPTEAQPTEAGAQAAKEGFLAHLLKKQAEKKDVPKKEKETKADGEGAEAEPSTTPAIEEVAKKAFGPFSKLFSSKVHEKAKPESSAEQVDASTEAKPEGITNPEGDAEAPPAEAVVEATQSSPTVKARTFSLFGQKSKPPAPEQQKEATEAQLAVDQSGHNPTPADTRSAFRRMSSIFRSKSKSRENKEEPKPEIAQISEESAERTGPSNNETLPAEELKVEESQGMLGDVPAEAIIVVPETESSVKEVEA